jgi:hypothetical protein
MVTELEFIRVGDGWIAPSKICHALKTDEGMLILHLVNGRRVFYGHDAEQIEAYLDRRSTQPKSQHPHPTLTLVGGCNG